MIARKSWAKNHGKYKVTCESLGVKLQWNLSEKHQSGYCLKLPQEIIDTFNMSILKFNHCSIRIATSEKPVGDFYIGINKTNDSLEILQEKNGKLSLFGFEAAVNPNDYLQIIDSMNLSQVLIVQVIYREKLGICGISLRLVIGV